MAKVKIPTLPLASEDEAARLRAQLRANLVNARPVTMSKEGKVILKNGGQDESVQMKIPTDPVASEDEAARLRAQLRANLVNARPVTMSKEGKVILKNGGQDESVQMKIPTDPVASPEAVQWYKRNPSQLMAEKVAMETYFPNFELHEMEDGQLYWIGELGPAVYESLYHRRRNYMVMALYQNNHPEKVMGSSVHIYLIKPEITELVEEVKRVLGRDNIYGFHHVIVPSPGEEPYLCTTVAEGVRVGRRNFTAATALGMATKWLAAYEMVLTGDMKFDEEFNNPNFKF